MGLRPGNEARVVVAPDRPGIVAESRPTVGPPLISPSFLAEPRRALAWCESKNSRPDCASVISCRSSLDFMIPDVLCSRPMR